MPLSPIAHSCRTIPSLSPIRSWSTAFLLGIALSLTGCVSKRKYAELDAVLGKTREALKDRKAESESLMQALDKEQAKSEALDKEAAALREEVSRLMSEKGELTTSVKDMSQALAELAARKKAADARIAEYKNLLTRFQALVDAGKLKVKVVGGRLVVELATDILFASGKATLSPAGKSALMEVAAILATMPDKRFQIEGHTDNVPIKTSQFPSNWELSSARSITVVKTLIEGGMSQGQVSAAAFGDSRPLVPNDSPAAKETNRRIEIVMVPDLSTLPGFEELSTIQGR